MISRLSREASLALLSGAHVGRLGCIAEGEPYVVPVNYALDGDVLLSHSMPGRKIEAMRANPRVCLQVDEIKDQLHWKSVIAYGTYEEIKDASERSRAINLLLSLFPGLTPVESLIAEDATSPRPVIYRIRIARVTGIGES